MKIDRREFLAATALAAAPAEQAARAAETGRVDFRYGPALGQTAYCFPDDHFKSLIGERGELRYGNPGQGRDIHYFPLVVEFGLGGMERAAIGRQRLEAPGTPIVHTRLDYAEAFLELTTFATNLPEEGRVDNVLLEVRPRTRERIHAVPRLTLVTRREARVSNREGIGIASLAGESAPVLLACDRPLAAADWGREAELSAPAGVAGADRPLTCFFRFPQQGQRRRALRAG